jgi:heptosyltransferase-2
LNKILIIRLSSLGDILLSTPLIRGLRKRFPESIIDFALKSEYENLLKANPNLNSLLTLESPGDFDNLKAFARQIRDNNYDIILDIHSNLRSRYLCAFSKAKVRRWKPPRFKRWFLVNLKLNLLKDYPPIPLRYFRAVEDLQVPPDEAGLEFFIPLQVKTEIERRWLELGFAGKKVAAIAPGAKWFTKRWPIEKYSTLANELLQNNFTSIIILGSAEEREWGDIIQNMVGRGITNFAGEFDLFQTGALLEKSALFIGNDSGLSHLAGAVGTPSMVIFGSTTKELGFFPYKSNAVVIEKDLSCRPCSHIGKQICPKKHFRCMNDINPDEVLEGIKKLNLD